MTLKHANHSFETSAESLVRQPQETLDVMKKEIFYRAHHRGTKEADWLIGGFIRSRLHQLKDNDIMALKDMVALDDESFFLQIENPNNAFKTIARLFKDYKASL